MGDQRRRVLPKPFRSRPVVHAPATPLAPPIRDGALAHPAIVDSAIYADGARVASPRTLGDTYRALRDTPDGVAWIGLYRPSEDELHSLAHEFSLHELAVEDAVGAHQRPKIERYDDVLFVVLRAASYVDSLEEVEFGELHVFVGPNFVITVRHAESPDLAAVRHRMESEPDLLAKGPQAILYAILDAVVDAYLPVVAGVSNDIDEIERQVFDGDTNVSRRIYELNREVIDFQRATAPLAGVVERLERGNEKYGSDTDLVRSLRDVLDHLTQVNEKVEGFRVLLRDILTVNATLVAERQNGRMAYLAEAANTQGEEVKRISSWAAILFTPTLIASIYGMNFQNMPELHWFWGYPFAIGLMLLLGGGLWLAFKRKGWL